MTRPLSPPICAVCGGGCRRHRHDWLYRCVDCGFLSSTLGSDLSTAALQLDESRREHALEDLRRRNFETVLDMLAKAGLPHSAQILDVGCGHGWFLEAAAGRGYRAIGIEPDEAIAARARAVAQDVRTGLFPTALAPAERFEAVVFNDVFEHLPDPAAAFGHVEQCLKPRGLLVVNLPLATGVFYRLADMLDFLGYGSPFDRMWQRGFPSPHRSYFSSAQLAALAVRHGFEERSRRPLPSLRIAGLWERLRYGPAHGALSAAVMWPPLVALAPLLRFLPADIGVHIFTSTGGKA